MPGAKKNGRGDGRTPFQTGERAKHCELLAKAAIALEEAREDVKAKKQQFDTIRDAIQRGGYLNDDQLELPVAHPNDAIDEDSPPIWMRAHNEATYHLFPLDGESAHCDEPLPADRNTLRADLVAPNVERLCPECCSAPYPGTVATAKALFGKVGDKPPPMAAAREQAKKKGAGRNGAAEKR